MKGENFTINKLFFRKCEAISTDGPHLLLLRNSVHSCKETINSFMNIRLSKLSKFGIQFL